MSLSLFADFPVTEAEVQAFLDTIPNLSASTFRRDAYRKAYRVEDKIRALKKAASIIIVTSHKKANGTKSKNRPQNAQF
jgi:hypothetical protein